MQTEELGELSGLSGNLLWTRISSLPSFTVMKVLESREIGRFHYERIQFSSKALGKDTRCGILSHVAKPSGFSDVYFFHGGGADDTQALQLGLEATLPQGDFRLILPSIENSFLHGPYTSMFFDELMPLLEDGKKPGHRYVTGNSMGGSAALSAFQRFPDRFDGAAAIFPVLLPFDLWDDRAGESYASRVRLADGLLPLLKGLFFAEFKSREQLAAWDPLALALQVPPASLAGKPLVVSVGDADEFGLYEGCERLNRYWLERGVPHEFEKVRGGRHDGPTLLAAYPRALEQLLARA